MDDSIEPKIKPLVDRMNATGVICTIASCQGHLLNFGREPYVYFSASVDVATHIARALRADANSRKPMLNMTWELKGIFNQAYALTFYLHAPSLAAMDKAGVVRSVCNVLGIWWLRRKLDADLAILGTLMEKATALQVRNTYPPDIASGGCNDGNTNQIGNDSLIFKSVKRVNFSTSRARVGIGRYVSSANRTRA